ncbi:MAG: TonB-dependent receptor, partial [Alphaproteobacteria bacterium]|nr:TonB-dependent receptor [Alphaproteobacteria bacterium]
LYGVEAEGIFIFNEQFRVSATAGYLNAEFDSVLPATGQAAFQPITKDSEFPNAPEFQSSLSPEFTLPLAHGSFLTAKFDWIYSSDVHQTFENDPELFQSSYNIFNGSLSLENEDNDWSMTVGVHNIADERIIIGGGIGRAPGFGDRNFNPPREWFVTLRKGF